MNQLVTVAIAMTIFSATPSHAMGKPENQCVFQGANAKAWFDTTPEVTSNCHYLQSGGDITVCDVQMSSIMCKKNSGLYKCVATTLIVSDVKSACQGPDLPNL